MAAPLAEAEQLAARLIEAESDDTVDVVALIDSAPEDVGAVVAAVQRRRLAWTEEADSRG